MIEVIKQLVDALENHSAIKHPQQIHYRDAAIEAGKQAIKELESQEPLVWIHNFIEGGISIGKRPTDLDRHPDRWTALYKEPPPCPTCEALARTVMLDQTSHDTPPQRTEQEPVAQPASEEDMKIYRAIADNYRKELTHPPQRTEQNFCSRCGKRTADPFTIHTCTPPHD
jgi:hypothetical protein